MLRVVSSRPRVVSSYCTYGKQSWCVSKCKPCTAFYFPSIGRCSLVGVL